MKLISYSICNNTIKLSFDAYFSNLSFIKMISLKNCNNDLDCETIQIKYSKHKNFIELLLPYDTDQLVIYIEKIDKEDVNCAFKVPNLDGKVPNLDGKVPNLDGKVPNLDGKVPNLNGKESEIKKESELKILSIKNQNIFAKIKKL
jgi:hypothetical protein